MYQYFSADTGSGHTR